MSYKNPAQQKEYQRQWYLRKKQTHRLRESLRQRRQRNKDFVNSLKDACSRCGYSECPAALEFHHPSGDDKTKRIAKGVLDGWSLERLEAEIAICILLCSNCHRYEHWCK